jgi:hypothetical protein
LVSTYKILKYTLLSPLIFHCFIGSNISAEDAQVIDATGKLVIPGG